MPTFDCRKCLPTNVPDEMSVVQKNLVASSVRDSNPIYAMQKMRDLLRIPLSDAKNIAFHITLEKGKCHKCKTDLMTFEGNCPKCKRLNLDW